MSNLGIIWHKFRHWEYWPTWVVYFPFFFLYLGYSLRLRSIFYFTSVNPDMTNGGAFLAPKDEIYNRLPPEFIPATYTLGVGQDINGLWSWMSDNRLSYPVLAKPNMGLRGAGLKVLYSKKELIDFLEDIQSTYLIQEFIDYDNELGVFFIKNPETGAFDITSIVKKAFITVRGDGKKTIGELMLDIPRYAMQYKRLEVWNADELDRVLSEGELYEVEKIGNHSLGTTFLDGQEFNNDDLKQKIKSLLSQLSGIYYGRVDLKYSHAVDNQIHNDFKVLEINGAFSEPTHIYDPKYSILYAWKTQYYHFRRMYQVCKYNLGKGIRPLSLKEGLMKFREHFKVVKAFKEAY